MATHALSTTAPGARPAHGAPTRRTVFALAPALALVGAAPLHSGSATQCRRWREFITTMTGIHPDGRRTTLAAFKAGLRIEDLSVIILNDPGPTMMFETEGGATVNVGPNGVF